MKIIAFDKTLGRASRAERFSDRVLQAYGRIGLTEGLTVHVKDAADPAEKPAEVFLYDEIGFWGVTAGQFRNALAQCGDGPVRVRINSPGGDVFDGVAIYNAIKEHGNCDVMIDGLAASAASYIAEAGTKVMMAETAMMMIHKAWGGCVGNADDMQKCADVLGKIDGQVIAPIYAAKSGKPVDHFTAAMKDETWYTAAEAKTEGLIDEIANTKTDPNEDDPEDPEDPTENVERPGFRLAGEDWKVGAARDLPVDDSDTWDGAAAKERMLDAAGFNGDNPDPDKAKRGFLAYDAASPKLKGSYKLPFADIVGGTMKAVKGGVHAAASRLPNTDVPQDVKDEARKVLDGYEKKLDPDAKARASLAMNKCRMALAQRF